MFLENKRRELLLGTIAFTLIIHFFLTFGIGTLYQIISYVIPFMCFAISLSLAVAIGSYVSKDSNNKTSIRISRVPLLDLYSKHFPAQIILSLIVFAPYGSMVLGLVLIGSIVFLRKIVKDPINWLNFASLMFNMLIPYMIINYGKEFDMVSEFRGAYILLSLAAFTIWFLYFREQKN